jgi:hypothetical protein
MAFLDMDPQCRNKRQQMGLPYSKSNCDKCGSTLVPGWQCAEQVGPSTQVVSEVLQPPELSPLERVGKVSSAIAVLLDAQRSMNIPKNIKEAAITLIDEYNKKTEYIARRARDNASDVTEVEPPPPLVSSSFPWKSPLLAAWEISGMNHYYSGGVKHLFVSMTRHGKAIKAEGSDSSAIWAELERQAKEHSEDASNYDFNANMQDYEAVRILDMLAMQATAAVKQRHAAMTLTRLYTNLLRRVSNVKAELEK